MPHASASSIWRRFNLASEGEPERIVGGGRQIQLPWPDLASFPPYGLVRTRKDFDDILAKHAVKHGARLLESTNVTGPIVDERTGAIIGVRAKTMDPDGRDAGAPELEFRAPLVVAADGNSSRLSMSMDRPIRDDRPLGVAGHECDVMKTTDL